MKLVPVFDSRITDINDNCIVFRLSQEELLRHLAGKGDLPPILPDLPADMAKSARFRADSFAFQYAPSIGQFISETTDVQLSERGWRILLFPWLQRLSRYISNGVTRLQISEKYISSIQIETTEPNRAKSFSDWLERSLSLENQIRLDQEICTLWFPNVDRDWGRTPRFEEVRRLTEEPAVARRRLHFKGNLFDSLTKLHRNDEVLIVNPYLPRFRELALHIRLGQFPSFLLSSKVDPFVSEVEPDPVIRDALTNHLLEPSDDTTTTILKKILSHEMPLCFLEGFSKLQEVAEKRMWPSSSKVIFTSNAFDQDEIAQFIFARMVEKGAIYVLGQHGNHHAIQETPGPSPESFLADRFLTWGWSTPKNVEVPVGITKTLGKKLKPAANGEVLYLRTSLNRPLDMLDSQKDFIFKFNKEMDFFKALTPQLRERFRVRHHPLERSLWNANSGIFPGSETRDSSLWESASSSRLIISGYDSTPWLEFLSLNFPVIAFLPGGFQHIRSEWHGNYEKMQEVGLLFVEPELLAKHVEQIWENVNSWWLEPGLVSTRTEFVADFCRPIAGGTKTFAQMLRSL